MANDIEPSVQIHQTESNEPSVDESSPNCRTPTGSDGHHDCPNNISAFINMMLEQLTDPDSREQFSSFVNKLEDELHQWKDRWSREHNEAVEAKGQLKRATDELSDLQSAAALMVSGQDDAVSNLKRRYDEELDSWRSIYEQQLSEANAASQTILNQLAVLERTKWLAERSALIASTHGSPDNKMTGTVQSAGPFPTPNPPWLRRASQSVLNGGDSIQTDISSQANRTDLQGLLQAKKAEVAHIEELLKSRDPEGSSKVASVLNEESMLHSITNPTALDEHRTASTETTGDAKIAKTAVVAENSVSSQDSLPSIPVEDESQENLVASSRCEMCANYEVLLQNLQVSEKERKNHLSEAVTKLALVTAQLDHANEEREGLANRLKTNCSGHVDRIGFLENSSTQLTNRLDNFLLNYREHRKATEQELARLTADRQAVQSELDLIRSHYDALLGRRLETAAELGEQPIQLPPDKVELELVVLRLKEENISLRLAREHLDERLQSTMQFHRQQVLAEEQERAHLERTLQSDLEDCQTKLAALNGAALQRDEAVKARNQLEADLKMAMNNIAVLQEKLQRSEAEASDARADLTESQRRIVCLQTDVENIESVQADFVRLSQTLQIQLERLRDEQTELRWVNPEETSRCFACESVFPSTGPASRKTNCRHCGKVHCPKCITHTIQSTPSCRPAPVCDVCHTLLNKHIAPYFSTNSSSEPATPNKRLETTDTSGSKKGVPSGKISQCQSPKSVKNTRPNNDT